MYVFGHQTERRQQPEFHFVTSLTVGLILRCYIYGYDRHTTDAHDKLLMENAHRADIR